MKLISIVLLLLHVSLRLQAFDEIDLYRDIHEERLQYTCDATRTQGIAFRYCYRNLDTTNNQDIIYFFHGLDGDEQTWFKQYLGTLIIQKWWKHWGYRPRIVTVSFGPEWLLVNNQRFPLLPLFTNKIMPYLESKMGGLGKGRRHLIGQSMGGFNAAEVSLKSPGLFSRVALLCPAISTIGPFSSDREIDNYITRTGATRDLVESMLKISRAVFLNQEDWLNHDPLVLIKKYHARNKSRFYITIGQHDEYGFQEGAKMFYFLAKMQAFFTNWLPVPGGHCNFSRKGTAQFIIGE
jgi:pimeloyl-ACP methyl ester carboxylesterase